MAVSEEESSSSAPASSSRSRSAAMNGGCYLAKTVLRGSVVLQVVYGHIRFPSSNDVVFGKETSIELVIIDDDGVVQSICEQPVFGTIKDLAILPWNDRFHSRSSQIHGKDILVVISDSGKLSFLAFCNEMHRFFPLTHVQLSSLGNSRNQIGRMLAIDSNGCFIAASAYENKLALFSVSTSCGNDIIDKKICCPPDNHEDIKTVNGVTEICGTIWSMCFISKDLRQPSKEHNPVLAILLNRERTYRNELMLLEWKPKENLLHVIYQYVEAGPFAHHIVEVPHSYGLVILFRAGDAVLMDCKDAHNPYSLYRISLNFTPSVEEQNFVEPTIRIPDIIDEEGMYNVAASALLELSDINKSDPMNIDDDSSTKPGTNYVCSWSWDSAKKNNPRMIFSADSGQLFMVEIFSDSDGIKMSLSDCLYKGLPAKELLWVESDFIAAIVEMGDGMVLKLDDGRLVYRSPIQNIAPILDMSVVDYYNEKHDQMFACCGMAPEGSFRIIRSGISVEKLLKTAPIYQGITGTWTVKMKVTDRYHSFLVLSFVEETRVLSVGVSFSDVTDSVGFQPDVSTLACGLMADGLLVQIHKDAVRLCVPIASAHPEGVPLSSPVGTSWSPNDTRISLGAVGHNVIVVATSSPCFLYVLGLKSLSAYQYELYQLQHVRLQDELSCISIPQKQLEQKPLVSPMSSTNDAPLAAFPAELDLSSTFIIGTHKPSVEVLSFSLDKGLQVIAIGSISLTNTLGTTITGCVPQDVKLVLVDRPYILSGLRNGMLLRFEWPSTSNISLLQSSNLQHFNSSNLANSTTPFTSVNYKAMPTSSSTLFDKTRDSFPIHLQLIAVRRIGITPAFLVPLSDSLDADVIALSDRPWLLQTARHSLSYTSISFQPSTHATPVCSTECPKGILFVADNSLNLVEMVSSKRLNVQKFNLDGTPRKVLYHSESKLLVVLRTDLNDDSSSDVCCIDPLSGSVVSSFKLDPGETGKCMELVKSGNDHVLVVGTSLSSGPVIMPSGEAESTRGRLLVLCLEHIPNSDSGSIAFFSRAGSSSQRTSPFCESGGYATEQLSGSSLCSSPDDNSCDGIRLEESEPWQLRLTYSNIWPGVVLAICPYLDRNFLASAGNAFYVCGFSSDNSQRVRRLAGAKTRFMIMTLTAHLTRIAVGDCRDGIMFYSYQEDARKLEQLYCDPVQRLVADCILMDVDTAAVSDRKGSVAILSCLNHSEENSSPECNLAVVSSFYMGEIAMRIRKLPLQFSILMNGGGAKDPNPDLNPKAVKFNIPEEDGMHLRSAASSACWLTPSVPELGIRLAASVELLCLANQMGSFSYKLPADDVLRGCRDTNGVSDVSQSSIMASTLLGSIITFVPLTRVEYELLEAVQARLVIHPLTAPILGNDHNEFRSRESSAGALRVLDGDMLAQFLELTSMQQEAVLALPLGSHNTIMLNSKPLPAPITVSQVVRLLERVHYALN
nr:pre-mRNA-splicing factor prp12 isoform X1 [Ipomoea trifida]